MLLVERLPDFADELRELLMDRPDLAASVSSLSIVDKCRCGDDFCSSIYTLPPPTDGWGPGHENVVLGPGAGMIILDVTDGRIGMIEVLYRKDIKDLIETMIP